MENKMTNEELLKSIKNIMVKEKCPEIYQSYFAIQLPFTERALKEVNALTDEISGAIDAISDGAAVALLESEAPKGYVERVRESFEEGDPQKAVTFFNHHLDYLKGADLLDETNNAFSEIQKLFEEVSKQFEQLASEMRERQKAALIAIKREMRFFEDRKK